MELDAVFLSRLQFAFTVAFHIIFPTFTIGLSAWIATLLVMWRRTGQDRYRDAGALLDAHLRRLLRHGRRLGHRAVLPVRHQLEPVLGSRRQCRRAADRLRGADRLLPRGDLPRRHAVRLEAGAAVAARPLGDPGRRRHGDLGLLDHLGQFVDAVSRRPRRARRHRLSGRLDRGDLQPDLPAGGWRTWSPPPTSPRPSSCWPSARAISSPASIPTHARTMLRMGVAMAAVLAPLQLVIGDQHGLDVAALPAGQARRHRGALAERRARCRFVAVRDPRRARRSATTTRSPSPMAAACSITHSLDGSFAGLKDFPPADRPPVVLPFFAFRIMVGIGLIMIALALWGAWLWWRGRLERVAGVHAAGVMVVAGRLHRHPRPAGRWRRSAGSRGWRPGSCAPRMPPRRCRPSRSRRRWSCSCIVYGIVFAAGIVYMNRLINRGPTGEKSRAEGVASRPLPAADRCPPRRGEAEADARDLPAGHLGAAHRHGGDHLRRPRRLRPRHRHPLPVRRARKRSATR